MEAISGSGWFPVHHAAYKNHLSVLEDLIESSGKESLEAKTDDSLQNTPLLLAIRSGSLEMVHLLVTHGADITYVNHHRQGVIEISALHSHLDLLKYFISLDHQNLNVYKKLVTLIDSDTQDEVLGACLAISQLISPSNDRLCCCLDRFVDNGLVSGLVEVLRKNVADDLKISALTLLKCVLRAEKAKRKIIENNEIEVFLSLVFTGSRLLLTDVMDSICELASEKDFAEKFSATLVPAIRKVVSSLALEDKEDIVKPTFKALGLLAAGSTVFKDTIGKQSGLLAIVVKLFQVCQPKSLLLVWSDAVGRIAEENVNNQNVFLGENIGSCLLQMLKSKTKEVQMSAVKTLHRLVDGNSDAQKRIIESKIFSPLVQLFKRSKTQLTQETIGTTLWVLAGSDTETQRMVAARIGITLLVEFLSSPSYMLNLIGARGLTILLQGPYNLRNAVMSADGTRHLVRLLRSHREDVVLGAIQALQQTCLGVGFMPHAKNQNAVANSHGLKFLVALMRHAQSERIQVEAALAIAACVLGHSGNQELIGRNSEFSYGHILLLLRSPNEEVHLTAGSALAAFAFNSTSQQTEIAQRGGVIWSDFGPFLQSTNQNHRALASFQLVVLAHIISDKDPSYTCAVGIQTLIGLLETAQSNDTLALAADCVARLTHARTGLSAAMVSIDVVNLLCSLLSSPSEQVKGSAAIVLSYLSFNHLAERQLLQRCRKDPDLMKVLIYYNKKKRLSESLLERWKHMRELTLPPVRCPKILMSSAGSHAKNRPKFKNSAAGRQFVPLPSEDLLSGYHQGEATKKNHLLSL
ncbi:ankyrin and armadillo repeat-containing protein-like isoform X2 [Pseudophryne corroboree]